MRNHFKVISIPTYDTPEKPVIVLSYDDKKYLFNCGEGTQRQLISQRVPIRKIRQIFTTSGWESHGGLAGLLLGMADSEGLPPHLGIHGPKNLAYYMATLRAGQQRGLKYTGSLNLEIVEHSVASSQSYVDSNVCIRPIVVLPAGYADSSTSTTDLDSKGTVYKGLLTQKEIQSPSRVSNIAHSVWSGRFLERHDDGSWGPFICQSEPNLVNDGSGDLDDSDKSLDQSASDHKARKRKPSSEFQDRVSKKSNIEYLVTDNSLYRPSLDRQRAFGQYMQENLPEGYRPYPAAISYHIQGQAQPGKFDPIQARRLGVRPGPDFGRLQKGQAIHTAEGVVVSPSQVMGPPRTTPPVLILDCPSVEYISSLVAVRLWKECEIPSIIVHSGGPGVFENETYQKFMDSFGPKVKHYLCRGDLSINQVTNIKSAEYSALLSKIAPKIFLSPSEYESRDNPVSNNLINRSLQVSTLRAQMELSPLLPTLEHPQQSNLSEPVLSLQSKRDYAIAINNYAAAIKAAHLVVSQDSRSTAQNEKLPGSDAEITTLGTGSAGPSNYRNVAGTLIRDMHGFAMLLDCGEGTLGQLKRAFGSMYLAVLREIKVIFISHMHADHHLGLIGLIRSWMDNNRLNEETLFIICPYRYGRSILEYSNVEDISIHRITFINSGSLRREVDTSTTHSDHPNQSITHYDNLRSSVPCILRIETVPAIHSANAMCLRIDHHSGWSLAYSGDTRPCPEFVQMAQGVTCLIHEATFENDKCDEAIIKKHSTLKEALGIASAMNARTTIMTHFSQRYPKLPMLKDVEGIDFAALNTGFAVDLMQVRIGDIWKLGAFLQAQIELEKGLQKLTTEKLE